MIEIARPYLLFLGDASDQLAAKTANGIAQWRREDCVGQIRLYGCQADVGVPDVTLAEAVEQGAKTLVIGVANRGGTFSPEWQTIMMEALDLGLDIASGLHERVGSLPQIAKAAKRLGRTIHDVRHPTGVFPVASGERRSGRRLLTIGTDCSIGKMFTALAIERELKQRGADADFRATGQTGILIAGGGVSVDAVVSDFVAGAVEQLCPAADPAHWDIIEGQASLLHPSYAGVTLALLHGAQPDAMVLCHEPTRTYMRGLPHRPMPYISEAIAIHERGARITNPTASVIGIALNTSDLEQSAADDAIARAEETYGLPCGDPMRGGIGRIVDRMLALFPVMSTGIALVDVRIERYPIRGAFTISRGTKREAVVVVAELAATLPDGRTVCGLGECVPYARYGETVDGVVAAIQAQTQPIAAGLDRLRLQGRMPVGAARNALDCAFWDIEAKAAGVAAWKLAGLAAPQPLVTAFTLSLDTPQAMGAAARAAAAMPLLKLKLGGAADDIERVAEVRRNAPRSNLIVDANEGWTIEQLRTLSPQLAALEVALIEQPLPAAGDDALGGFVSTVPLGADESCHDIASLPGLVGRYRVVNIKLDKTGGLTAALQLKAAAEKAGFGIMVGCMVSTSLAMAPAFLLAQGAGFVDLDGPLLLARDRSPGLTYSGASIAPPPPALWG